MRQCIVCVNIDVICFVCNVQIKNRNIVYTVILYGSIKCNIIVITISVCTISFVLYGNRNFYDSMFVFCFHNFCTSIIC